MDSDSDIENGESSEDEDYVPEVSGESESAESDFEKSSRKNEKVQKPTKSYPRRRGGLRLRKRPNDNGSSEDVSEEDEAGPEFETLDDIKRIAAQEKEKERVDNLWQEFKTDTAKAKENQTSSDAELPSAGAVQSECDTSSNQPTLVEEAKYSFAGEDVVTSKPIKKDSVDKTKKTLETAKQVNESISPATKKQPTPGSSKRSGIGAILGGLSKKPKISTLEKSKLDWDTYKEEEGLDDELKSAKDSGFLDRQEFLQRADVRQFNIEKEARLSSMKNRK